MLDLTQGFEILNQENWSCANFGLGITGCLKLIQFLKKRAKEETRGNLVKGIAGRNLFGKQSNLAYHYGPFTNDVRREGEGGG